MNRECDGSAAIEAGKIIPFRSVMNKRQMQVHQETARPNHNYVQEMLQPPAFIFLLLSSNHESTRGLCQQVCNSHLPFYNDSSKHPASLVPNKGPHYFLGVSGGNYRGKNNRI